MDNYINLQSAMGTRYIINALFNDFIGIMEDAKKSNRGVDIANCKLGPACANELRQYYKTVDIIDSLDEKRHKLLQDNIKATFEKETLEAYPELDFSRVQSMKATVEILKKLESMDKCKPINVNAEKSLAALCYCIMVKPEVDFDLTDYLPRIYDYICNEWKVAAVSHNKYIRLTRPDYKVYECVNGVVETDDMGRLSEINFVQSLNVLPYEFGTEVLVEIDEDGVVIGEWANVVNKLLKTLGMIKLKKNSILTRLEYSK